MNHRAILSDYPDLKLMPGRCLIELDALPDRQGSIVIPETARDLTENNIAHMGRVLKMEPRRDFAEEFQAGDKVWVMLLASDLGQDVILTENTRVYAVLEEQ